MRVRWGWVVLGLVVVGAGAEKPRKPVPALAAVEYPMHETHAAEHVTIAAEPCDTKELRPKTRVDYAAHGFLPVRVIVSNDGEFAVNLDDARIHFIAADGTSIPAATDDELQRGLFTIKSATGTKLPLGLPIPITVGKKNIDKSILLDEDDFGFKTTTVGPHATVAGYLYYSMSGVDTPVLANATLELRKVRFARDNKALESFEIALGGVGSRK